jgi:hypothetical protein
VTKSSQTAKKEATKSVGLGVGNHQAICEDGGYGGHKNHSLILSISGVLMTLVSGFWGNNGVKGTSSHAKREPEATSVVLAGIFDVYRKSTKTGRKLKRGRKPFTSAMSTLYVLYVQWVNATQGIRVDTRAMGDTVVQYIAKNMKKKEAVELLGLLPIAAKPHEVKYWDGKVDTRQTEGHKTAVRIESGLTDLLTVSEFVDFCEDIHENAWDDDWTYSVGSPAGNVTVTTTDF